MASALVAILLWGVLLAGVLSAALAHASESCVRDARAALDAQWLTAIEQEALAEIAKCSHCPQKPFGYQHAEWEQFRHLVRIGDCVVFFRSNPASWQGLFGREGYALVRTGRIVRWLVTVMS